MINSNTLSQGCGKVMEMKDYVMICFFQKDIVIDASEILNKI